MDKALTIACANCGEPYSPLQYPPDTMVKCPRCLEQQQVEIFPAFYRKPAPVQAGQTVLVEGESSCFYHAQKKAVVACDGCGRFLCALCDVEFAGQRLCPACIEAGKTRKKIKNLETHRTLYDDTALALVLLPLLPVVTFWLTIFTAPVALSYVIRYWNTPSSIIPRSKFRLALAGVLALLETAFWVFILTMRFLRR